MEVIQFTCRGYNANHLLKSISMPQLNTIALYASSKEKSDIYRFKIDLKTVLSRFGNRLVMLEIHNLSSHTLPTELWTLCPGLRILGVGSILSSLLYFSEDDLWAPWRKIPHPPLEHPLYAIHIEGHPLLSSDNLYSTSDVSYPPPWSNISYLLMRWSWNDLEAMRVREGVQQILRETSKYNPNLSIIDRNRLTYEDWR